MKVKACAFVIALLCTAPCFATPIVSLNVTPGQGTVGDVFTVDVSIGNVDPSTPFDFFALQFDFGFDADLTEVTALEPGNLLAQFGLDVDQNGDFVNFIFTAIDDTVQSPGTIGSIFGATLAPVTFNGGDSDVFARLTLKALRPGDALLSISNIVLDIDSGPLDPAPSDQTASVTINGSTDLTPVPEPATVLMVGGGLVAAIRKYRARNPKHTL